MHVTPTAFALALASLALAYGAEDVARLRLVPFPREIRLEEGTFPLSGELTLEAPEAALALLGEMVQGELKLAGLAGPKRAAAPGGSRFVRLSTQPGRPAPAAPADEKLGEEGYVLRVSPEEVVAVARGDAGLFYAVQTVRQLIRANRTADGKVLPCLTVRDWPALRWRCYQDDLTRGPSSRLATMQRDVDLGALVKLNVWTYYMEYQFAFAKHPKIGPPDGSFTPDDLRALVAYARPRHTAVMGNQQSFGHFSRILSHPEYAELRETGYLLTPVNEGSYRLLDDLYSEVLPLLPFEFFNVCCDETWGLGKGPSKALADKIGVGGVYVRHIRKVHELVKGKYGKRMMMWGDIILRHPKHLEEIPKDVVMLTWGYGPSASFEGQIVPFAKSGYEFFVCPGVSNWSRILPDFGVATTNIGHFVRDGVKHGAIGMLNTAWEDDGEALNAPKWHGHAWGAECAWTGSATPPEAFNRRIGAVVFGEKGDRFGQAIELLAQTHRLAGMRGMNNARFWQDDFTPRGAPASVRRQAKRLLDVVQPAIEHLEACRKEAVANAEMLDYFLHGARRMELIGTRMLDGVAAAALYAQACAAPRDQVPALLDQVAALVQKNRDATKALGEGFSRLWLAESKPYALDWTLRRYAAAEKRYAALAAKLEAAKTAAGKGQPLPDPYELGLAVPESLARRTRPHRVVEAPLRADAPWLQPGASHRLGLVVRAGKAERHDLPVEVDIRLPAGLLGKPVQAFRLSEGKPSEVPAQLDATGKPGVARLILLVHGKLATGAAAEFHVYLGLAKAPPALPGAAVTRDGAKGAKWLENDKVRLLLGPEGAHVYRWEVKALEGRDLAMPGESGWAGFSDMARGYRSAPFKLECVAKGPACARYRCTEPDGLIKTVSLFAGASWMEVVLSDPTGHYWDFDPPKNFAADGPTPGTYLFANGKTGPVAREADGVPGQVRGGRVPWAIKWNEEKLALGLATPEVAAAFRVAPGAGAGGVGIEASPAASHFVTFAGVLEASPRDTMERLRTTLDLRQQPQVELHGVQGR